MDSSGNLLLSEGYVIENRSQAEALVSRGMYADQARVETSRKATPHQPKTEPPSAFRSISLAVKRLGVVLRDIHQLPDARERILGVVQMINFAISLDEDIALATIQLNQSSGHYPVRHCVDTAILATLVARSMKKTEQEIQDIVAAALTMNISILALQEQLQGRKEALFDDEKVRMHHHPIASIKILHDAGIEDSDWLNYVLMHHEQADGSGYPLGSLKSDIPQNVKILYLADVFCARISARGYRNSMLPNAALKDIFVENRAQVDSELSPYFIKVLGLYMPGTFVCLKNKEIAVISYRGDMPSRCVAHSLVKPNGDMWGTPVKRDTREEPFSIAEAIYPIKASVNVNLQQIWGPLASL